MVPRKLLIVVAFGCLGVMFWPDGADFIRPYSPLDSKPNTVDSKPLPIYMEGRNAEPISDRVPALGIDSRVIRDLVGSCFQSNDPVQCLLASGTLPYDRELFAVLLAEAKTPREAVVLACVFILKSDPRDALEEFSALHMEASSLNFRVDDIVLEAGFRMAIKRDSEWRDEFVDQLALMEVFTSELSDIGVIMTGVLIKDGHSELKQVLREGLLPEANGTDLQQVRAVAWLAHSATDSFVRHMELAELLKHFSVGEPSEAAEMVGILLLRPSSWPDNDPLPSIQLVDQVLSNPHWGQGLANQINADYPNGPPRGISKSQWETIRLGLEYWD